MLRFGLLSSFNLQPALSFTLSGLPVECYDSYHLPHKKMDDGLAIGYQQIIQRNKFKINQINLEQQQIDYLISTEDGYLKLGEYGYEKSLW